MEYLGASFSFSQDQMALILNLLRIVQDQYKYISSKPYPRYLISSSNAVSTKISPNFDLIFIL